MGSVGLCNQGYICPIGLQHLHELHYKLSREDLGHCALHLSI